MTGASSGIRLTYSPALDGIRALSILGIMANHGGIGWADGGFISVNVFFVLSGFLITSLLVKEWGSKGMIRLRTFWTRRARRLLPALFVLLGGIAIYAWLLAPLDGRSMLRADSLATLFYMANWHEIVANQSYFAQTAGVSPLLHTWTLAIEEQFYLLWPLIVAGLLRWRRSTKLLTWLAVAGAAGSALEMALLFHPGSDPSRLYYGTDTRAQDLLTGAALALLMSRRPVSERPVRRTIALSATLVALAGFAFEWSQLNSNSSAPYRGGFLAADVFVAVVIFGVVQVPDGFVAHALGLRPLAYVGKISYALYLWHWPVFVVLDHQRTGLSGMTLFAARMAASFVPAVASSHLVEMPIRRGALTSWRAWVATPAAALATAGVVLAATVTPAGAAAVTLTSMPAASTSSSIAKMQVTEQVHGEEGRNALPAANSDPSLGPSVPFSLDTLYGKNRQGLAPILLVGDSISLTLFMGIYKQGEAKGLEIIPRGVVGCGLSTVTPLEDQGVIGDPFPECSAWPSWWKADVSYYKPKVVCLVTGYWEAMNRYYKGRWQHLGDPAFDSYVTAQLQKAVSILSAGGAKVAIFTSPYFENGEQANGSLWPEADPQRIDDYNSIVKSVAKEHPGKVAVVEFGKDLDPHGHFTTTIDGVRVRAGDGVHTTLAGDSLVAPEILPQIARLAGIAKSSGGST